MTVPRAAELRKSGVTIYVIAVNDADIAEAEAIAGSTGLVQHVHNEQQGQRAVDVIADRICQRQWPTLFSVWHSKMDDSTDELILCNLNWLINCTTI